MSALLCVSVVCSGVYGSYQVSAASLVGAYTAFNVWQMILLTLGVTCLTYEAVTHDDAVVELQGNFNEWTENTNLDGKEEIKAELASAVQAGTTTGKVSLKEKVWDALKDWTADVNGYARPVAPPADVTVDYNTFSDVLSAQLYISSVIGTEFGFADSRASSLFLNASSVVCFRNKEYSDRYYFLCLSSDDFLVRYYDDYYRVDCYENGFRYGFDAVYVSGTTGFYGGPGILRFDEWDMISICNGFPCTSIYNNTINSSIANTSVIANDDYDYVQGLGVGTYDVVTPGRYWDENEEEVRGDVLIPLPGTIGVNDLVAGVVDGSIGYTDALVDVGVYPVDEEEEKDLIFGGTIQSVIDLAGTGEDVEIGDGTAGTVTGTFVNILTGLFDKVLDALKELADSIISGILGLFVPEDGFIEGQLDALLKKLSELGIAPYDMSPIFSGNNNENPFKDITATIRGHEVVVVSFAHLDMFINRFRPVIRGLMALFLIFYSINQFFSLLRLAGVMEGGHVTTTSTSTSIVPVPGEFSHGVRGSGDGGRIGQKGGLMKR